MSPTNLSADLAWWRVHRTEPQADHDRMRDLLERLRSWKAEHDRDRSMQPPPFLRMAWDGVFGDEDSRVSAAIGELEAALGEAAAPDGPVP